MIKAIIFDLDGTLLDTSRDICAVINKTLLQNGLKTLTLGQTLKFVGDGAKKLVERAVLSQGASLDCIDKIHMDFCENYAACDNSLTTLYDGETEALAAFERAGIKLAVCTNKPQKATENVVKKHLSAFDFSCVLGHGRFPVKPDPAGALHIMETLGVSPEDCLFVGDGEPDIRTAKNAEINCVSALWGFRDLQTLKAAGGECFAENFAALKKIILG